MAVLSARIGVFDARDLCTVDGFKTTRSWLVAFGRMSQGAATGWLNRGRMLRELPALAAAGGQGTVSAEHLAKVHDLAHRVGLKAVVAADEILADLSSTKGPAQTQQACERIAAHLDPDGATPDPEKDFQRREIEISPLGRMLSIKGPLGGPRGGAPLTVGVALARPTRPAATPTAAPRRVRAIIV